jgi:hypothetical protein
MKTMKKNTRANSKSLHKTRNMTDELTRSPILGTIILKDWKAKKERFTSDQVELNKLAAQFVDRTPEARSKLAKIVNNIGPFECKLCNVVYTDPFELAMHNCPRVRVAIFFKFPNTSFLSFKFVFAIAKGSPHGIQVSFHILRELNLSIL